MCIDFMNVMLVRIVFLWGVIVLLIMVIVFIVVCVVLSRVKLVNIWIVVCCLVEFNVC